VARRESHVASLSTHHVGIVVSDLAESLSFYRDTLGLTVEDEFTLAGDGIGTAVGVEGVAGDFVHLDADGTLLELIEYEPSDPGGRAQAVTQRGAKHVGFAVDDIEAFYESLPEDAAPLSEPQEVAVGIPIVFFRDPDGNFVEVVEA
jgi:catechol 2,3-dioxygenase-like lactoylglutathione lyase family enzyme